MQKQRYLLCVLPACPEWRREIGGSCCARMLCASMVLTTIGRKESGAGGRRPGVLEEARAKTCCEVRWKGLEEVSLCAREWLLVWWVRGWYLSDVCWCENSSVTVESSECWSPQNWINRWLCSIRLRNGWGRVKASDSKRKSTFLLAVHQWCFPSYLLMASSNQALALRVPLNMRQHRSKLGNRRWRPNQTKNAMSH